MIIEKHIKQKIQKLWPDQWKNIITYFKNKEDNLKEARANVTALVSRESSATHMRILWIILAI